MKMKYWKFGRGAGLGNALFSRLPVESWQVKALLNTLPTTSWHEQRSVVACRLTLPGREQGDADRPLDVYATHLDHMNEDVRMHQLLQMVEIVDKNRPHLIIGDLNAFYKADYSPTHWKRIKSFFKHRQWPIWEAKIVPYLLSLGYIDCWKYVRTKAGRQEEEESSTSSSSPKEIDEDMCTVWINNPLLRIDYIFASADVLKSFDIVSCEVLTHINSSDHFPLLLELK
jgi:endonuclease/exonuclease/phosphatase family metal-dependent hydrolase